MDPANYEQLRNRTLLFFIEKLIDTQQQQQQPDNKKRTLHDLSCQFGSKGFTKEMRQIAGGSQSGLKKFLSEYPSIFCIDGDLVTYHDTTSSAAPRNNELLTPTDAAAADPTTTKPLYYGTAAANYFRDRLLQYGIGVWVPIKSLLGHRSQAPAEVRHVSGQHLSEFRSFLSRFPDIFTLDDGGDPARDNVVILTEFADQQTPSSSSTSQDHSCPPPPQLPLLSSVRLVEWFGSVLLDRGGPMMLEQLFHVAAAANQFAQHQHDFIKTPNDLKSFFHIHNQCFHVTSSLVTLQPSYSVGLLHLTQSANRQAAAAAAATTSSPDQQQKQHVALKAITKPKPILTDTDDTSDTTAAAPPPQEEQTLKTRVSRILLKTLTENVERDNHHHHQRSSPLIIPSSSSLNGSPCSLSSLLQSSPFDEESLKSALFSRTVLVSNTRKGHSIIHDLISSAPLIAVDCEGVNLGDPHAGKITQIQISPATAAASAAAGGGGVVYIFDILTQPGLIPDLKLLLQHQHVTKIMHDCRNDSVNLYREHGIRLRNVFDTQAAHVVIQGTTDTGAAADQQEESSPTEGSSSSSKKVKNISLNNLCALYCNNAVYNPFKDKIKTTYRHDVRYWSRRPLTRQMISYACCDVLCLPPIHAEMSRLLAEAAATTTAAAGAADLPSLLEELTEDQILAHIHPDEIRLRRRIRKNETDLRELKAKIETALHTNTDIVLSNREMRLLKHLELSDVAKEKLKSSLKVAKKLEKMENKNNPQAAAGGGAPDSTSQPSSLTGEDPQLQLGSSDLTANLNTIDNLQAIIDNIFFSPNNNNNDHHDGDEDDDSSHFLSSRNPHHPSAVAVAVDAFTQTHSTGDIVVMNVYKE